MINSFAARQHDVMMLDIADFQIDQHKATQDAMIKDQIDSIALPPQNTAG